MPVFSGNIEDPIVNYLLELDCLKRLTTDGGVLIGASPRSNK